MAVPSFLILKGKQSSSAFSLLLAQYLFVEMLETKWGTPSFFKVMIGGFRTTLRIPPSFKKHIGEKVSKSSVVRNYRGLEWKMKMGIVDGNLFFRDGWEFFISDNEISLGDFLVFFYDGDVGFDVRIYGISGCEKEGCAHSSSGGVKVKEEDERNPTAEKPSGYLLANREKVSQKRKGAILGKVPVKKRKLSYKVVRAQKAAQSMNALKAACAIKRTNPHFVTTCTISNAYYMSIPLELAKEQNLIQRKLIDLQDPHGTIWPIKLSFWRDGRLCLTTGWTPVYNKNGLKQGDVCVFEIVQGGTTINLHIFRDQEYSAKSISRSGEIKANKYNEGEFKGKKVNAGRRLLTEDQKQVLNAAKSVATSHAKFVSLWCLSRFYHMRIPKNVAAEVGIKRNQSSILIDPLGKEWPVQIVLRSHGGQVELGTGWSNFCRGNKLASGDACVFEFVKGADAITVHIFRVEETKAVAASEISEQIHDENPLVQVSDHVDSLVCKQSMQDTAV